MVIYKHHYHMRRGIGGALPVSELGDEQVEVDDDGDEEEDEEDEGREPVQRERIVRFVDRRRFQ